MWQTWAPLLPRIGVGELDIGEEEDESSKCEEVGNSCEKEEWIVDEENRVKRKCWRKKTIGVGCQATDTGLMIM